MENKIKLLFMGRPTNLVDLLDEFHPFDIAQVVIDFKGDELDYFFSLDSEFVANVLSSLEHDEFVEIVEDQDPKIVASVVSEMDIDDAVDVLQEMEEEDQIVVLRLMDTVRRDQIKELMDYKDDTAGSIMTTEFIDVPLDFTVKQAMRRVIDLAKEAYAVNVIYIHDNGKLVGVLSLRELIIARAEDDLKELMTTNIISVTPSDDQIIVAETMKDYDFTVLPVVDRLGKLKGIVTIDDVVDVIEEEAIEDISALAGVTDVDIDHDEATVGTTVRNRLPWLTALLFVGFVTSIIIASFEETLNAVPILSMFLPLILNMSGNTGTQALAVTVRGISTNQFVDRKDVFQHMFRELKASVVNGFLLSVLTFAMAFIMGQFTGNTEISFSVVISISVFLALVIAAMAGALIPLIIHSLKIDPAVASGPFITTINDIISLTIYLALATTFIVGLS